MFRSSATQDDAGAPIVIIGAGPAGLTAADELVKRGRRPLVVDQDCRVGGLAQTAEYHGFRFDIGGHRFFTKVPAVQEIWRATLREDFLRRPRLSRIYYDGHLFQYPLKPLDALRNLGLATAARVICSYLYAQLRPVRPETTFEDWVTNRFGRTLYRIFFESYTEKVWGIPGREIRAQWAAQRIKGLSLRTAVLNMLKRSRGSDLKTLIEEFEYPRHGPGMMWEAFARRVEAGGGRVQLDTRVVALKHDRGRVTSVTLETGGRTVEQPATHVISTMPMRDLVQALDPAPPARVAAAAEKLRYRDFLTVALVVDAPSLFPDNWIYVHETAVKVGRIQNFKNWSPEMVPDPSRTCLGLEYFCSEGDPLWALSDDELIALGTRELGQLRLVDPALVSDGTVVRMRKAYPVYDEGYELVVDTVRQHLDQLTNLQLVGRNGMHKYNNQDHSMVTAMLAVRNLYGERHDVWAINADDEYHEEATGQNATADALQTRGLAATQPRVPLRVPAGSRASDE